MAFSSSSNLKLTAGNIIQEALEILGVLEEGESPSTAQNTSCMVTLNNLIKAWNADTQVWAQAEFQLNLVAGQDYYQLTTSTTDRENDTLGYIPNRILRATLVDTTWQESASLTIAYDNLQVSTFQAGERVTFSGGSGGTVVTDDGVDGMTVSMDLYETAPANNETITGGTSGATADVNGTPTATDRSGSDTHIALREITQQQWFALSDKSSEGRPSQFYQKRNPVGVAHDLWVWPRPEDTTYDLKLWIQYPYQDADATTDDVWFTQEWYLALSFELAYHLSFKYGIPLQERILLRESAQNFFDIAATYETDGSLFLQPDSRHG